MIRPALTRFAGLVLFGASASLSAFNVGNFAFALPHSASFGDSFTRAGAVADELRARAPVTSADDDAMAAPPPMPGATTAQDDREFFAPYFEHHLGSHFRAESTDHGALPILDDE